ncbi:MAG TPA: D-alanyl-D-alanine carboxypeptidase/D-alanyl-D-alanine-endopeptidase [Kofleriaceae bacterium]|nr:D-alanyl-D-alanine carboxypeptidase/D-alanyl-D-alanine-endopeptidase [Kofleriaceae bacterium]
MCRAVPPALLLALAVGCSGVVTIGGDDDDSGEDGDDDDDGDDGTPVEPDPFEPAPAPLELPAAVLADVSSRVRSLVEGSPYSASVLVVNRTTGQVVAELSPDRLLKPASNTKIYTTAAALELLGEDHGLTTRVLADSAIGGDGVVDGDLYVVLEHDFTLSSDLYDGPRVPLDRIARQLARRGLTRVTGTVRVLGESVYEANSVGYLDLATERSQTTTAVGEALTAAGIARGGLTSSTAMAAPGGAVEILAHAPLSLAVGSSPLNTDSNNEFADLLVRHIGWKIEGESSTAAGTRAVLEWLGSTGVPSEGVVFHDGSGLSHDNRISARSTVELLEFMEDTPVGPIWAHTFAIAGVRGTLGGRMTGGNTVGRVFGKTGSLTGVITLSGFLENKHDGQRYYFSVLFNNVGDQTAARSLGDQVVGTFAGNLRGGEARLPAPALDLVRPTGTPGVLDIEWSPVDGADGYLVWLSEDGRVWRRDQARYVRATSFHAGDLSASAPTFVRITARAAGGLESNPSPTYAATASDEKAEILLVDANDRWMVQPSPENVLGANHSFVAALAESAAAAGRVRVASARHEAIERGDIALGDHAAVVWALGEESVTWTALSASERDLITDYVGGGGALIASGAELVWALADQGSAEEKSFASDVLAAGLENDDAGTYEVVGEGPLAEVGWTSFLAPDGMDILFPDSLSPASGGQVALRYLGGTGGAAAVVKGKVLVTGFPIEAVPSASARAALLGAALTAVTGAAR